jgi:hypothetical protein
MLAAKTAGVALCGECVRNNVKPGRYFTVQYNWILRVEDVLEMLCTFYVLYASGGKMLKPWLHSCSKSRNNCMSTNLDSVTRKTYHATLSSWWDRFP